MSTDLHLASTGRQALYWVRERETISEHLEVEKLIGIEERPGYSGTTTERWYLVLARERSS